MSNFSRNLLLGCTVLMATGCASQRGMDDHMALPEYQLPEQESATAGSLYSQSTGMRLFEDLRASRVGDILTVRLVERTIATKSSNTSTSKSTAAALSNPTILGRPTTRDGDPLFTGSLNGSQSFEGAGSSNQSNSLNGDITVTVVDRMGNGNLVVQGEKWVTINQGKEFIRLSGVIRPYDIEPDNTIPSGKVGNAQIAYSSKGVMAAANRMGLISRFFHSILYPY